MILRSSAGSSKRRVLDHNSGQQYSLLIIGLMSTVTCCDGQNLLFGKRKWSLEREGGNNSGHPARQT